MKYYRLYIDTNDSETNYHRITEIIGLKPTIFKSKKFPDQDYFTWTYCFDESEEDPPYDFINKFLDILEPKLKDLETLGIERKNITFWMVYEYNQQCGMEFHPQEMKRLGESGIVLCIDCIQRNK